MLVILLASGLGKIRFRVCWVFSLRSLVGLLGSELVNVGLVAVGLLRLSSRVVRALDFDVLVLLRGLFFRLLSLFLWSRFVVSFVALLGCRILLGLRLCVLYPVVVVLIAVSVVLLPVGVRVVLIIIVLLCPVLVICIFSVLAALAVGGR